jgi:hypothetical protein
MIIDKTPTQERIQDLTIASWIVTKEEQLTKINLGIKDNVQHVKVNSRLESFIIDQLIELLKDFKDVFNWTYKDLKSIPPEIAQHIIELEITVSLAHQTRYRLNPNYVAIVM